MVRSLDAINTPRVCLDTPRVCFRHLRSLKATSIRPLAYVA
jgi:hypothetical protein